MIDGSASAITGAAPIVGGGSPAEAADALDETLEDSVSTSGSPEGHTDESEDFGLLRTPPANVPAFDQSPPSCSDIARNVGTLGWHHPFNRDFCTDPRSRVSDRALKIYAPFRIQKMRELAPIEGGDVLL